MPVSAAGRGFALTVSTMPDLASLALPTVASLSLSFVCSLWFCGESLSWVASTVSHMSAH